MGDTILLENELKTAIIAERVDVKLASHDCKGHFSSRVSGGKQRHHCDGSEAKVAGSTLAGDGFWGAASNVGFAKGQCFRIVTSPADQIMSTDIRKSPSLETADSQAVIDHAFTGKPLDAAVANRVHERAEKVREELRKKGVTNFAVDLLRESRDDYPRS